MQKEKIIKELENVIDPELGVSVVDMGFIVDIKERNGKTEIKMTLSTPGCPMSGMILEDVKTAVEKVAGEGNVEVELIFDPPWSPEKMSDRAKKKLGFNG